MIVDVSMYQHGLTLDDLPGHVSGVIVKATQGTFTDPQFARFRQEAQDARWKWVGLYAFLSDRGVQNEAAYFLNVVGTLGPREFVVLDWENNAITGYQPPMADARAWMIIVNQALPGRVAWYSYRSNANKARQSGDFPWPLWLADPNADGEAWAHTLDAFLLQSGQQTLADINIDVNDIIDIATLDELTNNGDDMTAEQFAAMLGTPARANGGVVEIQLGDGQWYPLAAVLQYIHTESQRDNGGSGPLTINLTGTAS